MTKFIDYDDYMATLPQDRQARIHAKTNELLAKIDQQETVTLTLSGAVLTWLNQHNDGKDRQTQINDLLDEAVLNKIMA